MSKGFFSFFRTPKDAFSEEDQHQRNYALEKAKEEARQPYKEEQQPSFNTAPRTEQRSEHQDRPQRQERSEQHRSERAERNAANEGIEVSQKIVDYCKTRLQELVDLAQLGGTVEIVKNQNNALVLEIVGTEDLGRTIGKGGATLEALQILVRTFAYRQFETSFRLSVDAGEYKKKKTVHSKKRYSKQNTAS